MNPWIIRSDSDTGLEIRSTGDGRTIVGIAAPLGKWNSIRDQAGEYDEMLARGSFSRTIAQRAGKIPLHAMHESRKLPLGPVRSLAEGDDGLRMEAYVSKTTYGDEVLELVRDGALGGLSIGFSPIREEWSRDRSRRTHHEVALHEVSLVTTPAYKEALVAGLRSAAPAPPSLDDYQRQLWLLQQETR
jgi:HK97 family phage prohead protease